jgi:hypothetical protein
VLCNVIGEGRDPAFAAQLDERIAVLAGRRRRDGA